MNWLELSDDRGQKRLVMPADIARLALHDSSGDPKRFYLNLTLIERRASLMSLYRDSDVTHNTYSMEYDTRERAEEAYNAAKLAMGVAGPSPSPSLRAVQ